MWKLLVIFIIATLVMNIEGVRYRKRHATTGTGGYASAGGYAGTGGYGGGYGGGYDDFDYGYAPDYGFIDPYQFHQQLTAQILADHAAQNSAIASSYSTGYATANADASLLPDDNQIQQQIAAQQAYFNGGHRQSHYNNKGYKPNRYAPNYAAAGASIGPGGYHQTAYISPENPAIPNISNRFGASSSPGGYKGVSVSSFSSSSDVNGQRTGHRGAQTTINDNGKITTYRVGS